MLPSTSPTPRSRTATGPSASHSVPADSVNVLQVASSDEVAHSSVHGDINFATHPPASAHLSVTSAASPAPRTPSRGASAVRPHTPGSLSDAGESGGADSHSMPVAMGNDDLRPSQLPHFDSP